MRKFTLSLLAAFFALVGINAQTTPPSDAKIETWSVAYTFTSGGESESDTEPMEVAFSGSDVYFNFPNPITGNTWMKGTIDGQTATFAKGQKVGSYGGTTVYYMGLGEGSQLCDIVFNYDEAKGLFTLGDNWLLLNGSLTQNYALGYFSPVTVSKTASEEEETGSVPPASATIETWDVAYTFTSGGESESDTEPMEVAFSGKNVYFNFPNPITGNTWMRGTLNGSTVTFAKGQEVGSYGGTKVYYMGLGNDSQLCDIVFTYDEEKGQFTQGDNWLLLNGSLTQSYALGYFSNVTITKKAETAAEVVVPPAGLTTSEYALTGTLIGYSSEGWTTDAVKYNVRVGFSGNEVYVQGLCHDMPEAWVKGTRDSDGELTLPSGQYYGKYEGMYIDYDFYFAAADYPTTNPTWLNEATFSYDASTSTYTAHSLLLLNSTASDVAPYEMLAGVKLVKVLDEVATPATPHVADYRPFYEEAGYGGIYLEVPLESTTGANLLSDKLGYRLYFEQDGVQSLYVFKPAIYEYLTSEMSTVPYNFSDGYDFYIGGSAVYFYADVKDADKVGVQSVYTGGGETRESEISWYDIKGEDTGVAKVTASEPVSVTYTDLQGRPVSAQAKGLVLRTERMGDGTTRTVKTIRR